MAWKAMFPVMPPSPSNPLGLTGTIPGVLQGLPLLASRSQSHASSCPRMIPFVSDNKTKPKPVAHPSLPLNQRPVLGSPGFPSPASLGQHDDGSSTALEGSLYSTNGCDFGGITAQRCCPAQLLKQLPVVYCGLCFPGNLQASGSQAGQGHPGLAGVWWSGPSAFHFELLPHAASLRPPQESCPWQSPPTA